MMEQIRKTEYQGIKEVSARMGWSPNTLKKMIVKEDFPAGRLLGKRMITTENAIQEWCNKKARKV
jgi:predicted DNA-binding transcriptional regulator AlpA